MVIVALFQPLCGGAEPTATVPTCPPEPVARAEMVAASGDGQVTQGTLTDRHGRAALDLLPGSYLVTASTTDSTMVPPRPIRLVVAPEPGPTITLRYSPSAR